MFVRDWCLYRVRLTHQRQIPLSVGEPVQGGLVDRHPWCQRDKRKENKKMPHPAIFIQSSQVSSKVVLLVCLSVVPSRLNKTPLRTEVVQSVWPKRKTGFYLWTKIWPQGSIVSSHMTNVSGTLNGWLRKVSKLSREDFLCLDQIYEVIF